MQKLARVNLAAMGAPPMFVTLTYPREFPNEPKTYKSHARTLIKRLWRQFGKRAVVWRLEFQKRGAPHFHLLVWEPPERKPLKKWLLRSWYEICGTGDRKHLYRGVDVRAVTGWFGLRAYLAKYLAKTDGEKFEASSPPGRWWGVEGGALLKTEAVTVFFEDWRCGFAVRRAMRRYSRQRGPIHDWLQGCNVFAPEDLLPLLVGLRRDRPHDKVARRALPVHRARDGTPPDTPFAGDSAFQYRNGDRSRMRPASR